VVFGSKGRANISPAQAAKRAELRTDCAAKTSLKSATNRPKCAETEISEYAIINQSELDIDCNNLAWRQMEE